MGAGQLEGKGEDLCQRHGMYPMERETGCKTETQPIETKQGQIKTGNIKKGLSINGISRGEGERLFGRVVLLFFFNSFVD